MEGTPDQYDNIDGAVPSDPVSDTGEKIGLLIPIARGPSVVARVPSFAYGHSEGSCRFLVAGTRAN